MKNKKALLERKNELKSEMNTLVEGAKLEKRDLTDAERNSFEAAESEIRSINEKLAKIDKEEKENMSKNQHNLTEVEQRDYKAFASFIRGYVTGNLEQRDSDVNLTTTDNGALIPETIINKIIQRVENISPAFALATKYTGKGTIVIPVEDTATTDITVAYANEFEELTSTSAKYTSIELSGHLFGALTKVSLSLVKNTDFAVVTFVVNRMARKVAKFYDKECLMGSATTPGVVGSYDSANMTVTAATANKVTADELIDLQELVPDELQSDCIFIMSKDTRKAIRKLKDGQGNYLLERDSTSKWGHRLLNNDVFISDAIGNLGNDGKAAIIFGDFSGLAVKNTEAATITILKEKFITQHALGVVMWGELDAKVEHKQKFAVLKNPAPAQQGAG